MAKLFYQGHGSLRIISNNGEVLYVDPFIGEGYDIKADYAVSTHEHYDHIQFQKIIFRNNINIYRAKNFINEDETYNTLILGDFKVEGVMACNKNHPRNECVGFIIYVDNKVVYLSGDTSYVPEMENLRDKHIDYAFFCGDGIYNMDIEEASECANIVNAQWSIPYHLLPDHTYSEELANKFSGVNKRLIKPSQEIEL